jgi:hypothetical protein
MEILYADVKVKLILIRNLSWSLCYDNTENKLDVITHESCRNRRNAATRSATKIKNYALVFTGNEKLNNIFKKCQRTGKLVK